MPHDELPAAAERSRATRRDQAALQILAQVLGQRLRRGVAAVRVLLERLEADGLEVQRDLGVDAPRALRLLGQYAAQNLLARLSRERPRQRQQLVEHGAQRVDVRAMIDRHTSHGDLFRRHVGRRPQERTADRQPRLLEHARQSEVGDTETAFDGEDQVARLDVAVDHAFAVGVMQGVGDLGDQSHHAVEPVPPAGRRIGDAGRCLGRRRSRGEPGLALCRLRGNAGLEQLVGAFVDEITQNLVQRLPLDQLHHIEVIAFLLADGVNRNDVGVMQRRRRLGLAGEALRGVRTQPQGGRLDLERHATIERDLACLPDDAHAAAADFPQ